MDSPGDCGLWLLGRLWILRFLEHHCPSISEVPHHEETKIFKAGLARAKPQRAKTQSPLNPPTRIPCAYGKKRLISHPEKSTQGLRHYYLAAVLPQNQVSHLLKGIGG